MNPNTPGPAGYAVGILVGLSVLAAPLVVLLLITPDLAAVPLVVLVGLGVPVAILGAGTLHVALRCQSRQGVHVLGAAILGATGAFVCVELFGLGDFLAEVVAGWAGFASAAGRAVVSPGA